MAVAYTRAPRVSTWLLARRLRRRTAAELAGAAAVVVATRAWAAACAFCAMVLVAWLAAFARALSWHGWSGFRSLSAAGLSGATARAGGYEAGLVPVLAVWAALLLLVPAGYAIAYRAALAAAAALGALGLTRSLARTGLTDDGAERSAALLSCACTPRP
jgi:hypothetical protein